MRISPELNGADARERFEKFGLSVAGDAGHAKNLAFAQCERNAIDARDPAVVAHHQISRFERNRAWVCRAFFDPSG